MPAPEYFHTIGPRFSYRQYIIGIYLVAALVATLGLEQLIAVSIPVMVIIYPLAIALTVVGMVRRWIKHPVFVTRLVAATTLLFATLDGWQASGLMPAMLNTLLTDNLPLFAQHMTWLVAAIIALMIGVLYSHMKKPNDNIDIASHCKHCKIMRLAGDHSSPACIFRKPDNAEYGCPPRHLSGK